MNIEAAKAVADAVRTSLGPRGMDKMVGERARWPACRTGLACSTVNIPAARDPG